MCTQKIPIHDFPCSFRPKIKGTMARAGIHDVSFRVGKGKKPLPFPRKADNLEREGESILAFPTSLFESWDKNNKFLTFCINKAYPHLIFFQKIRFIEMIPLSNTALLPYFIDRRWLGQVNIYRLSHKRRRLLDSIFSFILPIY